MKPPYRITDKILDLVSKASLVLGKIQATPDTVPAPKLRKKNRVKTIQGTLSIEGNTLSLEQVTGIIEHKPVIGPPSEILEVNNAIKAYDRMGRYKSDSEKLFMMAHKDLMNGILSDAGRYRSKNVGVVAGKDVSHIAPQSKMVPRLMKDLFAYLKNNKKENPFIKSSVFHYELEFIHPFYDGNGRMGRLWQTLILKEFNPVFLYVPLESVIREHQSGYYDALAKADMAGESTFFIEFMSEIIYKSLEVFHKEFRPLVGTAKTRLQSAKAHFKGRKFKRLDYLELFKSVSTATASRDLKYAVDNNILFKEGDKRLTEYRFTP
jgi:Fic family protein